MTVLLGWLTRQTTGQGIARQFAGLNRAQGMSADTDEPLVKC